MTDPGERDRRKLFRNKAIDIQEPMDVTRWYTSYAKGIFSIRGAFKFSPARCNENYLKLEVFNRTNF